MHHKGRKGLIGQPARHQGCTREAGKDHLDSLGGTREAPGAVKGNPVLREVWTTVEGFPPRV